MKGSGCLENGRPKFTEPLSSLESKDQKNFLFTYEAQTDF